MVGDFLDETLASDSGSITPFRPSLVDSPGDLAEAEAAESLARTLDLRYGSRASQADGSVNPDSSGLGPHFFQRLAFQQTVANQTLFCWTAKVSRGCLHPLSFSSLSYLYYRHPSVPEKCCDFCKILQELT